MGLLDRFRRQGDDVVELARDAVDKPATPPAAGLAGLRFPIARGRGYRRDEVDVFLNRAATLPAAEIRDMHFRTERRGYAMDRVDAVLDALEIEARAREAEPGTA
jgi:DivIVA domain-containing protein